jgi:hypothetical protein
MKKLGCSFGQMCPKVNKTAADSHEDQSERGKPPITVSIVSDVKYDGIFHIECEPIRTEFRSRMGAIFALKRIPVWLRQVLDQRVISDLNKKPFAPQG